MSSDGQSVPPSRKSALDDVTATAAASTGNSTSTQADAQMIQSESYNLEGRGLCLIINNIEFDDPTPNRLGSDKDEENLVATFEKLGYDVWKRRNLSADDLRQLPTNIADSKRYNYKHYKIFIFIILSHGGPGVIYGTDNNPVDILKSIEHPFQSTNCPSLAGKPKLFFYQACRGENHQQRQQISADGVAFSDAPLGSNSDADFCSFYATTLEYVAWRNESEGSWFISELCKAINAMAPQGKSWYEIQMATKNAVVKKRGNGKTDGKETPQTVDTLLKPLHLTPLQPSPHAALLDFSGLFDEATNTCRPPTSLKSSGPSLPATSLKREREANAAPNASFEEVTEIRRKIKNDTVEDNAVVAGADIELEGNFTPEQLKAIVGSTKTKTSIDFESEGSTFKKSLDVCGKKIKYKSTK